MSQGDITPDEASVIAGVLEVKRKAIETADPGGAALGCRGRTVKGGQAVTLRTRLKHVEQQFRHRARRPTAALLQ
jgi:hypothetical protein